MAAIALVTLASFIFIILLIRTIILNRNPAKHTHGSNQAELPLSALEKLSELVKIPTESHPDYSQFPMDAFDKFNQLLPELYPKAFSVLQDQSLGPLARIYHWPGQDQSLEPVLFLSHSDVVPAAPEGWDHPPFGGIIENERLYGRGTQDIKVQIGAQLEALESLIDRGFSPKRGLYFVWGGDEEVQGLEGAQKISAHFRQRGIRFAFVLDEGGIIATDQLKAFCSNPVALLGVEEKGRVTYSLQAKGSGGHASMPPKMSVLGHLSLVAAKLVKKKYPSRISLSLKLMLQGLVPYSSWAMKPLLANLWLFGPLIRLIFSKDPATNSVIRTTRSLTMFNGGTRVNALPDQGKASFNVSILPGDTLESVEKSFRRIIGKEALDLIREEGLTSVDPVKMKHLDKWSESLVAQAVYRTFPGTGAVPFLVNGTTDSKFYKDLTRQIIRFTPLKCSAQELKAIHGINESISLENYSGAVHFYQNLIMEL